MSDRINETSVPSVSDAAALVKRLRMPRHDLIEPHAVNTQCRRIPFLIDERVKAADAIESLVTRLAEVTAERNQMREALRKTRSDIGEFYGSHPDPESIREQIWPIQARIYTTLGDSPIAAAAALRETND